MQKTIFKGASVRKSELNEFSVGLARLKDMHISPDNFTDEEINIIGFLSLQKRPMIFGRVGNEWRAYELRDARPANFRTHYIVIGKKIKHKCYPANYMQRDRSPRFASMAPGQMFRAFQVGKPDRKGRGAHSRLNDKIKIDKQFYGI